MLKMTFFDKKAFICLLICSVTLLISCKDRIIKQEMTSKNPIEFTYAISKDSLFNVITRKIFFIGIPLYSMKSGLALPSDILEQLKQGINNQDIFLWSIGPELKSKIYREKNGDFFDYLVSFYLHLENIDQTHTRVIIKTIDPKIIIGKELLPSLPHFTRMPEYFTVEPSTIEEYEILIEIGKLVGEKGMPPLHLPTKK
jgi:hypothetical protein